MIVLGVKTEICPATEIILKVKKKMIVLGVKILILKVYNISVRSQIVDDCYVISSQKPSQKRCDIRQYLRIFVRAYLLKPFTSKGFGGERGNVGDFQ